MTVSVFAVVQGHPVQPVRGDTVSTSGPGLVRASPAVLADRRHVVLGVVTGPGCGGWPRL